MKTCVIIKNLNDCEYAVLTEKGFGCKYKKYCEGQRPKVKGAK